MRFHASSITSDHEIWPHFCDFYLLQLFIYATFAHDNKLRKYYGLVYMFSQNASI